MWIATFKKLVGYIGTLLLIVGCILSLFHGVFITLLALFLLVLSLGFNGYGLYRTFKKSKD